MVAVFVAREEKGVEEQKLGSLGWLRSLQVKPTVAPSTMKKEVSKVEERRTRPDLRV